MKDPPAAGSRLTNGDEVGDLTGKDLDAETRSDDRGAFGCAGLL